MEVADFVEIQETKLQVVDRSICEYFWGGQEVNWAFPPAEGSSSGILCVWNSSLFNLEYTFSGNTFLGVSGVWVKTNMQCSVVNIYSSCVVTEKKASWRDITMSKMGFGVLLWCFVGDFNAVKGKVERRGVSKNSQVSEHSDFLEFIDDINVIDLPVLGNRFTWFKPDGTTISILDRF